MHFSSGQIAEVIALRLDTVIFLLAGAGNDSAKNRAKRRVSGVAQNDASWSNIS